MLPNNVQPYFYRAQDGAKMHIVLAKGIHPYMSIEIKYSSTPLVGEGFYKSISDLKTKNNYVIIPNTNTDYLLKKDVRVVDIVSFIKKYL